MVIHLLEWGFIPLTYCVQDFGSVAGVGETFLANAKLKPLCGRKFVIHRRDTREYRNSCMWFLSNVVMCVLGNRNSFILENLWFSRAFMCIFDIKSLYSVGYTLEERTPHPIFTLIVWILFVFLLEGSFCVYLYDFLVFFVWFSK